jgi:hypothetical protein
MGVCTKGAQMMIIHQARAELAQKTLKSVNEIVGLVGAVGYCMLRGE